MHTTVQPAQPRRLRVVLVGIWSPSAQRYREALTVHSKLFELVAVVRGAGETFSLSRVPSFATFDDLLASRIEVDLAVIAGPTLLPELIVDAALSRGMHVLSDRLFCQDAAVAGRLYAQAGAAGLALLLGLPQRFVVAASLEGVSGVPAAGVRRITAHCHLRDRGPSERGSSTDLLLGPDGLDRLARALVLVRRGRRAVVSTLSWFEGRATSAIVAVAGGPRLTVTVQYEKGARPSDSLTAVGRGGSAKLLPPRASRDPASWIVKPSRGKPHALPVAALKEAHALLVGALPALLADPARLAQAVAHDLLLITVVDALGRSLDDNYGSVKVRLP